MCIRDRSFGHEAASLSDFDCINDELGRVSLNATFFSSLTNPSTRLVNNIIYAAVALVGALSAVGGGISVGDLSVFLSYASQYAKPFNEISGVVTELQNALACAARVFSLLDEDDRVPDKENAVVLSPKGTVDLKDVCFRYVPDRPLIEGFNLHVKPGQRIAIVGPTGCGKTTMINLLMRFYDVNSGAILVDGTDIRNATRHSLRKSFGMVLQDTWLFEGSIRDNLCYGKEGITDEQLDQVTRATGLYHLIHTLPEGYDTLLSDKLNLSAGQKQLMTIARAMIENAPMLILDEATSSVDTRTEMLIQQAMDTLTKGRTSFVIAHRLSTIRNADRILVIRGGRITESGTHRELLNLRGYYYDLYTTQFREEAASEILS